MIMAIMFAVIFSFAGAVAVANNSWLSAIFIPAFGVSIGMAMMAEQALKDRIEALEKVIKGE